MVALQTLGEDGDFEGKEFLARCPFHEDTGRRAHLYINLRDKAGVYHCFWSGCEVRGPFISYIMQKTGWNLAVALAFMRKISRDVPFMLAQPRPKPKPRSVKELEPYAFRHAYCYERGLTEATLQRYKIGYDKVRDAITFPWFDSNRRLIAVKFRPFSTGRYICEKGVEISACVYGLQLMRKQSVLWLVEGEFDTMYLDQSFRQLHADEHYAGGLGGKTLHPKAIQAILRLNPKYVVLMLDNDEAGVTYAKKIKESLVGKINVKDAVYPDGVKDPNQLTLQQINLLKAQIESEN